MNATQEYEKNAKRTAKKKALLRPGQELKSKTARRRLRDLVVEGVYRAGAVGAMGKIARYWEVNRSAGRKWPFLLRSTTPRIAILCYHRVGVGGIPLYSQLATAEFEAQVRYLRKNYRIISLDQVPREMESPSSLEPAVAVTFDDGYRGLFSEAYPILQTYQVPATIFLITEAIETGQVPWYDRIFLAMKVASGDEFIFELDEPRRFPLTCEAARMQGAVEIITYLRKLPDSLRRVRCAVLESMVQLPADELRERMLGWEQIRIMHQNGISFGAHTLSHPVVSRLQMAEARREICESKKILEERLNARVRHFAFPFGKQEECGEEARSILASAGFQTASTTAWGLNTHGDDPLALKRVQIGELGSQAKFAFQLNRLFLRGAGGGPGQGLQVTSAASGAQAPVLQQHHGGSERQNA